VAAQRHAPAPRQLEERGQPPGVAVDVAVRIDVARRTAHQLDEAAHLPSELDLEAFAFAVATTEVGGSGRGLWSPRVAPRRSGRHHEAGAFTIPLRWLR
jgi:hypothetical protein